MQQSFGRGERHRRRQAGFTLIELLVALFIFAIAALAIAAMTFMSIRGNAMTNQMSQATFLAQDMMEDLLLCQKGTTELDDALAVGTWTEGIFSISRVETGPGPNGTRSLRVTVSWTDNQGSHQVVVKSLW